MLAYDFSATRFLDVVFSGPVLVLRAQASPRRPGDRDSPVRAVIPRDVSHGVCRAAVVLADRRPHDAAAARVRRLPVFRRLPGRLCRAASARAWRRGVAT